MGLRMLKSPIALADPPGMWWPAIAIVVFVAGVSATVYFAKHGHAARFRDGKRAEALVDEAIACEDPDKRTLLLEQAATALERVRASENTPSSRFERQRDATFVLGFVRYEQERYVEAIDLLRDALRQPLTKATRARGLTWLAAAAAQCGDSSLAESSFDAALKIRSAPNARREYRMSRVIHMSVLHARRGAFVAAERALREATSFTRFAADPATNRARAEVEFHRRNFDETARLVASAVGEDEERGWRAAIRQADCWALGARAQIARRDFTLARAALDQGRALAPANAYTVRVELLLAEAALARLTGRPSDALATASAMLRENRNPRLAARLAAEELRQRHDDEPQVAARAVVAALRDVGELLAEEELVRDLGLNISPSPADRTR